MDGEAGWQFGCRAYADGHVVRCHTALPAPFPACIRLITPRPCVPQKMGWGEKGETGRERRRAAVVTTHMSGVEADPFLDKRIREGGFPGARGVDGTRVRGEAPRLGLG